MSESAPLLHLDGINTHIGPYHILQGVELAVPRGVIEPRKLFLIDEPTKGLAPAIIMNMIAAFRELKETAATILLVEQNFMFAKSLGDTVAVMDNGRVIHAGSMAELAEDRNLQHRLLGLSLDSHQ